MMDAGQRVRTLIDGVNRRDLSIADEVFARDVVIHITGRADPIVGVDAWKEHADAILLAFPDVHFAVEELLTVGDIVVTRWHARGTHGGPFGPVPATGKSFSIDALILDHFVDGKLRVRWEQYDQSLLLQQLGVQ